MLSASSRGCPQFHKEEAKKNSNERNWTIAQLHYQEAIRGYLKSIKTAKSSQQFKSAREDMADCLREAARDTYAEVFHLKVTYLASHHGAKYGSDKQSVEQVIDRLKKAIKFRMGIPDELKTLDDFRRTAFYSRKLGSALRKLDTKKYDKKILYSYQNAIQSIYRIKSQQNGYLESADYRRLAIYAFQCGNVFLNKYDFNLEYYLAYPHEIPVAFSVLRRMLEYYTDAFMYIRQIPAVDRTQKDNTQLAEISNLIEVCRDQRQGLEKLQQCRVQKCIKELKHEVKVLRKLHHSILEEKDFDIKLNKKHRKMVFNDRWIPASKSKRFSCELFFKPLSDDSKPNEAGRRLNK